MKIAVRAAIVVAVAFIVLIPAPVAAGSVDPVIFNARSDFRLSPDEANPAGAWSYRITTADGSRPLLRTFDPSFSDVDGVEAWSTRRAQQEWPWTPSILINNTGGDYLYLPEDGLFMHPSNEHDIVLRWRSPDDGRIAARLWLIDRDAGGGDGVGWSFGKPNHPLVSGSIANGGRLEPIIVRINVKAGDRIDLTINPHQDQGWDTTQVGLRIKFWPS
jgi:hypothetical protein